MTLFIIKDWREMESEAKVEMIKKAIIKVMEDEDNGNTAGSRRQLLNKLLSELEWLEQEDRAIIRELKEVKRQNSITHYLVTAMILLTVGWQLSEVSLILKIKDGLRNPFKPLGGMLRGFLQAQDASQPAYLPGLNNEDDDLSNN